MNIIKPHTLSFSQITYNKVIRMCYYESSKYHLYLTDSEYNSIVNFLIRLKNTLINQGKYTDGDDDVLIKLVSVKKYLK